MYDGFDLYYNDGGDLCEARGTVVRNGPEEKFPNLSWSAPRAPRSIGETG